MKKNKRALPFLLLCVLLLSVAGIAAIGAMAGKTTDAVLAAPAETDAASANGDAPGASGTAISLRIGEPTITVNGREEPIDENGTVPLIQNGRTLLPVRAVVEAMGGVVEWDSATQTVTLTHGGNAIRMVIGSATLYLNEAPQTMDVAPVIINSRTMLPIRFIAEGFGYEVGWDGATQTVTLTGPDGGENEPVEYAEREISVDNNGANIYGVAYVPDTGAERMPLVIFSHGLMGSYDNHNQFADALATQGVATYSFDFRGGGGTRSDGSVSEMSIMTEVSDLEAVLDAARGWDFVDTDKIVLIGSSQGGYVSAVTAARHVDEVAGLVINCPAFVAADMFHELYDSLDDIGDTVSLGGGVLGRKYAEDIWNYDVFGEIGLFDKRVLIQHGDMDNVVPISYSRRAAEVYSDAELIVFEGAGHAFIGTDIIKAIENINAYLIKINILSE
jgi:pimeloyl-ACP methyl ester carboxylesterase